MADPHWPAFTIDETIDDDGATRVSLGGELDLAVAARVETRLAELLSKSSLVRLDLSRLSFIDSTGIQTLLAAVSAARDQGRRLEVGRELTRPVQRVIELIQVEPLLWPHD
jgi:anti-sigma B factor antagonist